MVSKILTFATALVLAGCVSAGGSFCDIARPLRLSPDVVARMSEAEINASLAHNEKGAALCGWKP